MGFYVWGPGSHRRGASLVQPGVEVGEEELRWLHRDGTQRCHLPSVCWTAAAEKGGAEEGDPRSCETTVAG